MILKPHAEPTNEARAETKLVWAMPCKEEEDHRSIRRKRGKKNKENPFGLVKATPLMLCLYAFPCKQASR